MSKILPFLQRPEGSSGIPISEGHFVNIVDHYYEQRGWDKTTGWPTRAKLIELDLEDVADELPGLS